jgi:hypothetical protein
MRQPHDWLASMVRRVALLFLLPLFAIFGPPAQSQTTLPRQVRAAADRISVNQLTQDIDYLASDALRGRDTFSPGLDSAAQFIIRRLKTAGLKPFGDNGTYLQHFALRREVVDTAAAFLEFGGRHLRFGDFVLYPYMRPVDATAPVVFVGNGFRVPSMQIDSYAGVEVKGKFVLAQLSPPNGISQDHPPADMQGPRLAAENLGAVATLLIAIPTDVARWSEGITSRNMWSHVQLEGAPPSGPPIGTTIYLKPETARLLLADSTMADRVLNRPANADFPPSFQLTQQVTAHIPACVARDSSYNIVAVIEGSDPKLRNEYVTIAAHLDGALQQIVLGDSIFNAADDNASGSAGILAVAEQMMRAPRPRRSVLFIWETGHEIGLYGSRSFVAKKVVPTDSIVTHINVDMIGSSAGPLDTVERPGLGKPPIPAQPHEVFVVGPRVLSTGLDSLVEQTNRSYLNMRLNHSEDRPESNFYYPRTDAVPFIEHRVPTIDFFTGLEWRYHRSADEARYLDMNKVGEVSRTLMAVAWEIANAPQRPKVDKGFPKRVPMR